MIRKCIVHYGIHKTGTSSIQKTLQKNLQDSRFYYLNLNGSGNHSAPIQTAFEKKNTIGNSSVSSEANHLIKKERPLEDIQSTILGELDRAGDRIAIISGESISVMSRESLEAFRDTLSKCFDEIELVGYIRSPASFIESAFQQVVKGGSSDFNPDRLFPDYRKKFSRMENVFGQENIRYWKFDPKKFVSGCVVADFCSRLGMTISPESVVRINESLSLPALKLLYIYRKFGSDVNATKLPPYENSIFINALSRLDGPKIRFHSDIIKPILDRNSESIEWMEKRIGSRLEDNFSKTKKSIRSEDDLLNIGKIPTRWLSKQLGGEYEKSWSKDLSLITVAEWMKRYQDQLMSTKL